MPKPTGSNYKHPHAPLVPSPHPTQMLISPTSTSPSATALLSLTQDITALLSLSLEATASLVHDWLRISLSTLGLVGGAVVPYRPPSPRSRVRGESGRGLAVVILNAGESSGQSLSLQLAKSGYTVFPLLPISSSTNASSSKGSGPLRPDWNSTALSSLLLTWSATQKRLRARHPSHPGAIVPIITDAESSSSTTQWMREAKERERFRHAGETVRAYVRENGLRLVAVICAGKSTVSWLPTEAEVRESEVSHTGARGQHGANERRGGSGSLDATNTDTPNSAPDSLPEDSDSESPYPSFNPTFTSSSPVGPSRPAQRYTSPETMSRQVMSQALTLSPRSPGLLGMNESTLLSLYRANVLDPLSIIRELRDLLDVPDGYSGSRGRVIFVNTSAELQDTAHIEERSVMSHAGDGGIRLVSAARAEAARLLRGELGKVGVDVCEVMVGPMAPRLAPTAHPLRYGSDDSSDGGTRARVNEVLQHNQVQTYTDTYAQEHSDHLAQSSRERILAARLALLARLWAVDDALLYSSVRRAIEDRYPRYRHHAGLSPLVESVLDRVPGAGMVKVVGRWVLGRLLMPRGG